MHVHQNVFSVWFGSSCNFVSRAGECLGFIIDLGTNYIRVRLCLSPFISGLFQENSFCSFPFMPACVLPSVASEFKVTTVCMLLPS